MNALKTAHRSATALLLLGFALTAFGQATRPGAPAPRPAPPPATQPAAPASQGGTVAAMFATASGDHDRAVSLLQEALPLAERSGDPKRLLEVRSSLNQALRKQASLRYDFTQTTPWTPEQILAALEARVDFTDLADALRYFARRIDYSSDDDATIAAQIKAEEERRKNHPGADLDLMDVRRILTSQAGLRLHEEAYHAQTFIDALHAAARPRSEATDLLALDVISRRRAQLTPPPAPVDSPDLRARYAIGDPAAAYDLYRVLAQRNHDTGTWPENEPTKAELIAKATAQNYAPAQWLRVADLLDGPAKDLAQAAALARVSAEAGDAEGAFELAKLFASPTETGVARNYLEAERWFIEAGARQPAPGPRSAALELSNLYSGLTATGAEATPLPAADDATYRWARELLGRGRAYAENARLLLDYLRHYTHFRSGRRLDTDARLAALPPEVPPFSADRLRQLEAAAAQKSPEALLTLAAAFATGRGVPQDDARAVRLYREAADAGAGLPAFRALAGHYARGHGVNASRTEHFAWLTRAAETGDAASWRELAHLHLAYGGADRKEATQDPAAAAAAYERAVALGDPEAPFRLALLHHDGRGVAKDPARTTALLHTAAERGYGPAMRRIAADLIDSARPFAERDYAGALQWYRRAVEAGDRESRYPLAENLRIAGDLAAAKPLYLELAGEEQPEVVVLLRLGEAYDREANFEEALVWYRKAALSTNTLMGVYIKPAAQAWTEIEAGLAAAPGTLPHLALKARNRDDAEALFRYALAVAPTDVETARNNLARAANLRHPGATTAYYTDLLRSDRAAAPRWLQSQVENENPQAIYLLGMERAATDRAAGVALIQRAAGLGSIDAKFRVGMMQFQGQGLPPDRAAGLALIAEAADAGQPEALLTLGTSLVRGDAGVTADPARGLAYLRRAAAQTDHPPVAAQAAKFVQQFEQHHARQTFETLWANPETRFKELVAVYTAAEDKTPAVEFFAGKIAPLFRESTTANAYKPVRDAISAHYAVINTMDDTGKEQARWLLYRAVHAARLAAEAAGPTRYPDFLYNWIRPVASQ